MIDDSTDSCTPHITFDSTAGCSESHLNAFWEWVEDNEWFWFVMFVLVGFFLCFFGRRLFKPAVFIAGIVGTVSLIWIIFYSTFLEDHFENWVGWVVFVCSLLLGLIVGAIMMVFVKVGAFLLGFWGGFSIALLMYNAFLYLAIHHEAGFWCYAVAIGLIFGFAAIFKFDHIVINMTAFAGAYLVLAGIGLVAGHYQNPFTILYEHNHGDLDHIDPDFYAYMVATIILYVMGAVF